MIKKITLIAFALISFLDISAQMNAVIYSEAGEKFTLYLNGEAMNSAPQSNVKLQGLNSEFYQARVDFQDAALADFSNNNFALHPGMEVTYQVKKNKKGEYVLRFYTENPVSSAAASNATDDNDLKDFAVVDDAPSNTTQTGNTTSQSSNTKTTITTNVTGTNSSTNNGGNIGVNINVDGINMGLNVNVDESSNATTGNVGMNVNADGVNFGMNVNVNETNTHETGGNVGMNINVDGMNMGINMNVPNTEIQTSGTTTTTTTTARTTTSSSSSNSTVPAHTTRPSEPSPNQPSNSTIAGNGNCMRSMDAASFGKAKQTIESKGFDDTRLSTAKQVAKANCLSTDQIQEIMKIFGFEESRLEFAKYAYDFCFDKNNYYNVSQGFSFDSSTEELNEYIETK